MNQTVTYQFLVSDVTQLFIISVAAFLLAMALTPFYTYMAYRYRFWKKQRSTSSSGEPLQVFNKLHANKFQRNIPTMAGVIGVVTIAIITFAFNFSDKSYLPLAALVGGAIVGLIDDIINLKSDGTGVAGLRSSIKFSMIVAIGLALGWYFFTKIDIDTVQIPFIGAIAIGWLIIPLFAFVVTATANAVNISDGLDGLAGGLLIMNFSAFGVIALFQLQMGVAAFCFTVVGALLSYLWFNIYPARFFMGDVGSFAFGVALGVVAILTNSLLLLPVIGVMFVVEAGSSLIQMISKKFFKRKVFISAPIHHHLEATGWPETKVTMRFWLIGAIASVLGVVLAFAGGHIV